MREIERQLEEYLNYCENIRCMTPQTIIGKRYVLKNYVKWLMGNHKVFSIQEMTNASVLDYVDYNKKVLGVTGRTINDRCINIIAMLKYFRDMGIQIKVQLAMIPKVQESAPKRMFFTREEIGLALGCADDFEWLLISVTFDSGLRIAELASLRLSNFNGREFRFIGKGRKPRVSYITTRTYMRLMDYIQRNNITDYLWPSDKNKGTHFSAKNLRDRMQKAFRAAAQSLDMPEELREKFMKFYPHALRHSFGSDLQRKGASIFECQQLLGHSQVQTTEKYLHIHENRLSEYFDKYLECR